MKQTLAALSIVALAALAGGCANDAAVANNSAPSTNDSPSEPGTAHPANPNGTHVAAVDVKGWTELHCLQCGNSSFPTHLDMTAHFHSERNACGKDGYGALEIDEWNELATAANEALKAPALPEGQEYCVEPPFDSANWRYGRAMDGTTEFVLENGTKRDVLVNKGGQICSTISNRAASDRLLKAMHEFMNVTQRAGASECVRD